LWFVNQRFSNLPEGCCYRRTRLIGRGFGEVWAGEGPGGIPVAVKILCRAMDREEAQRQLQALELTKRFRHPFLLQTYAFWIHEDRLCIAMELADRSLRDRFKECQLAGEPGIPAPELLVYFREAADALDYLHQQNVQHRDIKPDNILIFGSHAKLADFGLAKFQQGTMATASWSGTPAYMAPEMWRGQISRHTDQYCLAISYAELRIGRRPFSGQNWPELMQAHLQGAPDLNPLSEGEQQVLGRALAKEPEQRYPSCLKFMQELEQMLPQGS
jgi:serine/threonine protein kinase